MLTYVRRPNTAFRIFRCILKLKKANVTWRGTARNSTITTRDFFCVFFFFKQTKNQTAATSQASASKLHRNMQNQRRPCKVACHTGVWTRGQRGREGRLPPAASAAPPGSLAGRTTSRHCPAGGASPRAAAPAQGKQRGRVECGVCVWGGFPYGRAKAPAAPAAIITCSARNGAPAQPTLTLLAAAILVPGRSHGACAERQAPTRP